MTESRGGPHPPCSLCGSPHHESLRDQGFLRCPERPLPAYVTRGLDEMARGICWAVNPNTGVHCTEPPHGDDADHLNAYVGRPWRDGAIRPA